MEATSCLQVSRKDETAGGIAHAISRIKSSLMTPGPLGMSETSPRAEAPKRTAIRASSMLLMQQILTLGLLAALILGMLS
jgi:hypothetical protein